MLIISLHQQKAFKTVKSYFRSEVRSEWYAYRHSALQSACAVFDGHYQGLNKVSSL